MSGTRHISGVLDPVAKPEVPDNTPVLDTSPLKPEDEVWYESGTGNRDVRIGMPVFCTEVLGVVFITSILVPNRVFTVREAETFLSSRELLVKNSSVFPITPERYRLWKRIQNVKFGNTNIFTLWQYLLPNPEAGKAVLKQLF